VTSGRPTNELATLSLNNGSRSTCAWCGSSRGRTDRRPAATVIPVLVYPEVRAAVAWLSEAFGFIERVRIGEDHRSRRIARAIVRARPIETTDRLPPLVVDSHEIAYDLAFSDPSHFTRFFRKQTSMTPQAFREGRGG